MPELVTTVMTGTTVLALIRVVLNALETCTIRKEFQDSGFYGWPVRRLRYAWLVRKPLAAPLNLLLGYPGYMWLMGLQLSGALVLLGAIGLAKWAVLPLIAMIAVIELLSSLRNGAYGTEGSDLMHLIVLCALTIYHAAPDPWSRTVVATFIALQAMLAYFTSRIVKLQSRTWRRGIAIPSVLSTENYGSKIFDRHFMRNPILAKVLCWSVIVFECSFPLVVLLGPAASLMLLSGGIFFHLMIAATMGLNGFFWSFVSTYPAIYAFSYNFHSLLVTRHLG